MYLVVSVPVRLLTSTTGEVYEGLIPVLVAITQK